MEDFCWSMGASSFWVDAVWTQESLRLEWYGWLLRYFWASGQQEKEWGLRLASREKGVKKCVVRNEPDSWRTWSLSGLLQTVLFCKSSMYYSQLWGLISESLHGILHLVKDNATPRARAYWCCALMICPLSLLAAWPEHIIDCLHKNRQN